MIARQVGECRAGEDAARGALLAEGVARYLDRDHLRAGVRHPPQQLLQLVRFRRGVRGRLPAARPARLDRADQARRHSAGRGDLLDQVRRGRLAVRARYAEEREPPRRLSVKAGGGEREGAARIAGDHYRRLRRWRAAREHGRRALLHGRDREVGAVGVQARERGEQRAGPHPPRVDRERAHVHPRRSGRHLGVHAREQILQQHASSNPRTRLHPPEYDGYPGGARVTFTLAPRLTMAPARGDCATARPLPRSSGSSDDCASRRIAERAPRPETSGTRARPGWIGGSAAGSCATSSPAPEPTDDTRRGAVSLAWSGMTSSWRRASCAMAPHAGAATVPPATSAPFPSGSSMTTRIAIRGASAGANPRKLASRLSL